MKFHINHLLEIKFCKKNFKILTEIFLPKNQLWKLDCMFCNCKILDVKQRKKSFFVGSSSKKPFYPNSNYRLFLHQINNSVKQKSMSKLRSKIACQLWIIHWGQIWFCKRQKGKKLNWILDYSIVFPLIIH